MNSVSEVLAGGGCITLFQRVVRRGFPETQLYVLYTTGADSEPRPFAPLLQYFLERGAMERLPWQREMARAVGLLLDYLAAHSGSVEQVPADALRGFAETLLCGSEAIGPFEQHGLNWPARAPERVARHLALVTAFTDWLSERTGSLPANLWRDATPAERLISVRRLERRSSKSLLAHAAYRQHDAAIAGRVRSVQVFRGPESSGSGEVKAFDATLLPKLLFRGFARPEPPGVALERRFRLRNMLITLLLHGGGLRLSEVFHLFVGDVTVDPEHPRQAQVRVFHPVRGTAPAEDGLTWRNREHYLRERWNLVPRNRAKGRFHAGWKNLALSCRHHHFARVHWFPTYLGEVFLTLFRTYVATRSRGKHPYLFVSERPANRGEPYTLKAFELAHAEAVRRIGLVSEKHRGTTPHGHRHAYGLALAAAKIDRTLVQRAMHHRSPDSQDVYTAAVDAQVSDALREATQRLLGTDAEILPPSFQEIRHD